MMLEMGITDKNTNRPDMPDYHRPDNEAAKASLWKKAGNVFNYLRDDLHYLFCKPIHDRRVAGYKSWKTYCKELFFGAMTNRLGVTVSVAAVAGVATFVAAGHSIVPATALLFRNSLANKAVRVCPYVLMGFVSGRVGQQAGQAADQLLAYRLDSSGLAVENNSYYQKNRWAITWGIIGALSAPGIMLSALPFAVAGGSLLAPGVVLPAVLNTIVQGTLAFTSAHLEGRAAKLKEQ